MSSATIRPIAAQERQDSGSVSVAQLLLMHVLTSSDFFLLLSQIVQHWFSAPQERVSLISDSRDDRLWTCDQRKKVKSSESSA